MKLRFHDHYLLYGVVVSALIGFGLGTALDAMRSHDFTGMQAAASTTTAAAPSSPASLTPAAPQGASTR